MANSTRTQPGTETTTPRRSTQPEPDPMIAITAFYETNKKTISTVATIVVVIVAGYFGYTKLYKGPAERESRNRTFLPTALFAGRLSEHGP